MISGVIDTMIIIVIELGTRVVLVIVNPDVDVGISDVTDMTIIIVIELGTRVELAMDVSIDFMVVIMEFVLVLI